MRGFLFCSFLFAVLTMSINASYETDGENFAFHIPMAQGYFKMPFKDGLNKSTNLDYTTMAIWSKGQVEAVTISYGFDSQEYPYEAIIFNAEKDYIVYNYGIRAGASPKARARNHNWSLSADWILGNINFH